MAVLTFLIDAGNAFSYMILRVGATCLYYLAFATSYILIANSFLRHEEFESWAWMTFTKWWRVDTSQEDEHDEKLEELYL